MEFGLYRFHPAKKIIGVREDDRVSLNGMSTTALNYLTHLTKLSTIPLTLMNTNAGLKRAPVEVECMISHRPKGSGVWHLRLFKTDGTEIPCQEEQPEALLPFNGWRRKVSFMAELPGAGAANYYLRLVEGETEVTHAKPALKFQSLANWLNAPPIAYAHLPVGSFKGNNAAIEPPISSNIVREMLSVQPENISLLACKRSRDGEALILRLQESCGLKTESTVRLAIPKIRIKISFHPLEINTVRIEKSGQWSAVDLIEES